MCNSVRGVGSSNSIADRNSGEQAAVSNRNNAQPQNNFQYSATGYQERTGVNGGDVRRSTLNSQFNTSRATGAPRMDAASERELARLNPVMAERIRATAADLRAQGINVMVAPKGGMRTFAEQDQLYAQGRTAPGNRVTNVRGGGSYHNYGLAVDLVPTTANGRPTWNASNETWNKIGAAGERQGLEWGGRWSSFPDRPHFQMTGGTRSASDLRSTYQNGGLNAVWDRVNRNTPGAANGNNAPANPNNPANPNSPAAPGGTTTAPANGNSAAVPTARLQRGARGEQVRQLQDALVKLGYMTQAEMNTGPGTFGPRTDRALRAFQAANQDQNGRQLASDGIYGPLTRGALGRALGGAGNGNGATPNAPANPNNPNAPANPGNVTVDTLARVPGSENMSREFKQKVIDVAGRLRMNPNHLMAIMSFESGLNPQAVNRASGATGLIQFLPSTARGLGTSTSELRGMSPERQLDFVERYLTPYRGRMNSVEDAYMAVFQPVAIGRSNDSALFSRGSTAYSQNSGLDLNRDGTITKGEAATRVRQIHDRAVR